MGSKLGPCNASDDRRLGSQLCTHCGLCCAGALHDQAVLDEDEIEQAQVLGLAVTPSHKPAFGLPCPMLQVTTCSIYGQRPRVCSRYRCGLLHRLEDGAVSLPAALSHVDAAKELVNRLSAVMPAGMLLPDARALVLKAADEQQDKVAAAPLRVAATAVIHYIDRYFRSDAEGRLLELRLIGDSDEAEK